MRTQELIRNPFKWLEITLTILKGLVLAPFSSKNRHSLYNKFKKYLTQAIKVIHQLQAQNKALMDEKKAWKTDQESLEAKIAALESKLVEAEFRPLTPRPQDFSQGDESSSEASDQAQAHQADLAATKAELAALRRELKAALKAKDKAEANCTQIGIKNAALAADLAACQSKISELEARKAAPKLNSRNSHRSSSFDMPGDPKKKPRKKAGPKKKQGAQPGHPRNKRPEFKPEEADEVKTYEPEAKCCPDCGESLVAAPEHNTQKDQIDIPPVSVKKIIHLGLGHVCPKCNKIFKGVIPQQVINQGYIGAHLTALIAILTTVCSVPIRKIQEFFSPFIHISLGQLNKSLKNFAVTLRPAYEELQDHVKDCGVLNIDETSHRHRSKRLYTWVFEAQKFTFYKIGTRSAFMLDNVLGSDYVGTIGSDYYSAYRKFLKEHPKVKGNFCMIHLKRDAERCSEDPDKEVSTFGFALVKLLDQFFINYNNCAAIEDKTCAEAQEILTSLNSLKEEITELCQNAPQKGPAKGISLRFAGGADASNYFTCLNFEIGPTNNPAELAIRHIVTSRKVSYFTQGAKGVQYSQICWSAWRTLRKQGKSIMDFFVDSQNSYHSGKETPSLYNPGETVPLYYREKAIKETEAECAADLIAKREEAKDREAKAQAKAQKKVAA